MNLRILITGVSRGIGRATATLLAQRGEAVTGTVRDPRAEPPASSIQLLALDLASDESIARLAGDLTDPIDILINNAGVATSTPQGRRSEAPLEGLSRAELHQIFDVNVIGTLLATRALLGPLRRGIRRTIINISSDLGSITLNQTGERYAYRSSKAALNMITRSLAIDLAPEGFTCVAWHPGWVRTDMGGQEAELSPEQAAAALCDFIGKVNATHNGGFYNYRGESLPW